MGLEIGGVGWVNVRDNILSCGAGIPGSMLYDKWLWEGHRRVVMCVRSIWREAKN